MQHPGVSIPGTYMGPCTHRMAGTHCEVGSHTARAVRLPRCACMSGRRATSQLPGVYTTRESSVSMPLLPHSPCANSGRGLDAFQGPCTYRMAGIHCEVVLAQLLWYKRQEAVPAAVQHV